MQNQTRGNGPWIFVVGLGLFAAAYVLMAVSPRGEANDKFDLRRFGDLPVRDHGRIKPIDTLARINLMIMSGKQETVNEKSETMSAVRWFLELMSAPQRNSKGESAIAGKSAEVRTYRIESSDLRTELGLRSPGPLFSFREIEREVSFQGITDFIKSALGSAPMRAEQNERTDLAWQFAKHIDLSNYETPFPVLRIDNHDVLALLGLEPRQGLRYGFHEVVPRLHQLEQAARQAGKIPAKSRDVFAVNVLKTFERVNIYLGMAQGEMPQDETRMELIVPDSADKEAPWRTFGEARQVVQHLQKGKGGFDGFPASVSMYALVSGYSTNDGKLFNEALDRYSKHTEKVLPGAIGMAAKEASFNAFAPFYHCAVLYVLVFLTTCVYWLWREDLINRAGFWLMVFTLLIHTWALCMRMHLQGRPPVTNLYSSAVFIGWGCVLLCVFMEWKFFNGIAMAVASLTGYATLLIAHFLGEGGDTMEMLQAVLDTNFWLATHVTTVTLGYAATFVAGLFGGVFVWMMLLTGTLNSFRKANPITVGGSILFGIAALSSLLIPALLIAGMLMGLWYLAGRETMVLALVGPLACAALAGALGFAGYLVLERLKRQEPGDVPEKAKILERFALNDHSRKVLMWMLYGTVCFAMLFSFVGTVLGGIWADQSWGRFWGWDPKENGALLIVIMNAMILHARWGGLVKERGIATLALVGNMVTMWSWFGTNQLGIGLHAYGFNSALVQLCRWFWVSQTLLIGVALLPLSDWRNYVPLVKDEPKPGATPLAVLPKGNRGSANVVAAR